MAYGNARTFLCRPCSGAPFAVVRGNMHRKPWACELIKVFVLDSDQRAENFPCHSNASDRISEMLESNYLVSVEVHMQHG